VAYRHLAKWQMPNQITIGQMTVIDQQLNEKVAKWHFAQMTTVIMILCPNDNRHYDIVSKWQPSLWHFAQMTNVTMTLCPKDIAFKRYKMTIWIIKNGKMTIVQMTVFKNDNHPTFFWATDNWKSEIQDFSWQPFLPIVLSWFAIKVNVGESC
jgi:hypothetical protein